MSKKLELLRRHDGQKSYDPAAKSASALSSTESFSKKSTLSKRQARPSSLHDEVLRASPSATATPSPVTSHNSFKTFFYRIGSTGMLNRNNHTKQEMETNTLYRSSSTSQLNSSSYIKGDDPTDGINLSADAKVMRDHTGLGMGLNGRCSNLISSSTSIKAASCDDIAKVTDVPTKRANFPYAFLRSKLSVLPEENGGSVLNHKKILDNTLMRNGVAMAAATAAVAAAAAAASPSPMATTPLASSVLLTAPQPYRPYHRFNGSAESSLAPRYYESQMASCGGHSAGTVNCLRSNSIRESITDESSSTISNSPRTSNIDWEPTYQRLNSCLSSNESGYDSDGRHTDEHHMNSGSVLAGCKDGRQHIRRLSSCSSANSVVKSYVDNFAVQRRFRPIKLDRQHRADHIGINLAPQYIHAEDLNVECRYLIAEIDSNGLAHNDGRLRIGDEIVNVNGNRLRGMSSFGTVQEMVNTFVNDSVELVIAHDEVTAFTSDARFTMTGGSSRLDRFAADEETAVDDASAIRTMPLSMAKRLSYSSCSAINRDCGLIDDLLGFDDDYGRRDATEPVAMQKLGDLEPCGLVGQRIQELQAHAEGTRRSPMGKGIELTPLQSSTEYVPVYANRATITKTISDDEKWQILSKKRSDQLSKHSYALSNEAKQRNSSFIPEKCCESIVPNAALIEADGSIRLSQSTVSSLLAKFETDSVITPQCRSIRIKKDLLQLSNELNAVEQERPRLRPTLDSLSSINCSLKDAKSAVITDAHKTDFNVNSMGPMAAGMLASDENDQPPNDNAVDGAKDGGSTAEMTTNAGNINITEIHADTATYVEGRHRQIFSHLSKMKTKIIGNIS